MEFCYAFCSQLFHNGSRCYSHLCDVWKKLRRFTRFPTQVCVVSFLAPLPTFLILHFSCFAVDPDLQAELHRDRIYGAHVAEYMEYLTEEDEAKYKEHFASYIENEITFDDVEEMYKETHKAIRGDPAPAPKAAFTPDKAFKNTVSVVAFVEPGLHARASGWLLCLPGEHARSSAAFFRVVFFLCRALPSVGPKTRALMLTQGSG